MKHCTIKGCTEEANNVPLTLCNAHTDELRLSLDLAREALHRGLAASYRYYIRQGQIPGVEFQDVGRWRSYEVDQVVANSLTEAVEAITVSEVDQDGGDIDCYGFLDASYDIQVALAKLLGETLDTVTDAAITARKGNSR